MPQRSAKQRAEAIAHIKQLLKLPEWQERSTNWIAMELKQSWRFVDKIRSEIDTTPESVRRTKNGKRYPTNMRGRKLKNFLGT